MAFQLSPGVNVSEIDLTTVVPSVATSIGAFAGVFAWGPVNEIVTISDEVLLVERFGKPDSTNYEHWFSASNFLAYSNNLKVVRVANTLSTFTSTSNSAATGVLIENDLDYDQNHSAGGANTYGEFSARFPGALGNSLLVSICDRVSYSGWSISLAGGGTVNAQVQFTDQPNTSTFVSNQGGANDEVHIIVIDEDGQLSGTKGTILEKFGFASKAGDAKDDTGNSNYYKNVINSKSRYVRWLAHPSGGTNWGNNAANTSFVTISEEVTRSLTGGADGDNVSANVALGFDLFENADAVDVSLIISGPANATLATSLISLAESRKDCVVFLSPEKTDVVDNYGDEVTDTVAYRNTLTSTSYAVMDSNWKYQYDKYNDVYRWIPLNGDIAGLAARTDQDRDPWFSPAGLNRGIIKNVIKLAWNPTKTNRDDLYVKGINPVVTFPGEGTMLYGDKTLLSRPSAFDRINVRRLFIVLEKAVARAARSSLFEFNDQFTRAQFVSIVEPFLRDVQGRRGITDFRVVCDETNNTAEVIDRNEFVGDIYIKPARSINFIQLNFVAVRTGVSFDEVVGRFG
jgi:phage tail sheath protein FI